MVVDVIDNMARRNYTFYIKAGARGGATLVSGPYELRVGCHYAIPILYEPNGVVYNLTLPLFEKRTQRLQFSINGVRSANSFCKIINYELIESETQPDILRLSRPFPQPKDVYMFQNCTSPPCTVVEFTQHYPVIHKFWILATADGGAVYLLPQFTREIYAADSEIVQANV